MPCMLWSAVGYSRPLRDNSAACDPSRPSRLQNSDLSSQCPTVFGSQLVCTNFSRLFSSEGGGEKIRRASTRAAFCSVKCILSQIRCRYLWHKQLAAICFDSRHCRNKTRRNQMICFMVSRNSRILLSAQNNSPN